MDRAKGRVGSRVGGGDGCGEGSDGREWRQLYFNNNKEREREKKKKEKKEKNFQSSMPSTKIKVYPKANQDIILRDILVP